MRRPSPVTGYPTLLLSGVMAAAVALGPASAQDRTLEYPVKAAYLYKFAAFVDWPADAFASAQAPVRLCVQGHDPFGALLDRTVRGQRLGARAVVVHRLGSVRRGSGCHVLYAGGSAEQSVGEALSAIGGDPVLTVTDARRGDVRGIVHFVIRDDRVRFHIDALEASRNGLPISSKLLSLAVSVRR